MTEEQRRLFEKNVRIVGWFTRSYVRRTGYVDLTEDIYQEAAVGLMVAVTTWKPKLGSLLVHAKMQMLAQVQRFLANSRIPVRLSQSAPRAWRTKPRGVALDDVPTSELGVTENEGPRRVEAREALEELQLRQRRPGPRARGDRRERNIEVYLRRNILDESFKDLLPGKTREAGRQAVLGVQALADEFAKDVEEEAA